jgi:enoyl-CoA hydratase/carnithine racemase
MTASISVEQTGRVALVTIDSPPLNALSNDLLAELLATIEALDADPGTGAIVLRGASERAFVAGANIKEFPALRGASGEAGGPARSLQELGLRIEAASTPVVVAIHGFCLGGGLELAMACDIRVCAEGAQLGQPEIKLGLIPGGGGTQRLPGLVGQGRAMLLNMTGDLLDAATAERWGLVDRVVAANMLVDEAMALAGRISSMSAGALAELKRVARETRDRTLAEGLQLEAEAFQRCIDSDDGVEGVAAFIEKREPRFNRG